MAILCSPKRVLYGTLASLLLYGGLFASIGQVPAGASPKTQLESNLVKLSQLPAGWSVDHTSSSGSSTGGCLTAAKKAEPHKQRDVEVSASYADGSIPDFEEQLGHGPDVSSGFDKIKKILNGCRHLSISSSGSTYSATVGAMSFPKIGMRSVAYQANFSIKGLTLGLDIIVYKVGSYGVVLTYDDLGSPDVDQLKSIAEISLRNLGVATSPSTAKSPVGTLSNPVLIGQAVPISGGWTVKVISVAPDPSSDDILNAPTAGYVYEIVTLQATRTAVSAAAPSTSIADSLVGPSRAERNSASSPLCFSGTEPSSSPDNDAVLQGGSVTFGDCISISTADSVDMTLALGSFDSNSQTWFATK